MKALKLALIAAVTLTSVSVAKSQTADEIIDKHIVAMGGKEKLSQIKSIYMENTVEVMGNEAPSTVTILNGKGYKSEFNFNGQKIVQVVTDKGGWMINPMTGSSTPTEIPAEQLKGLSDQLDIAGPLFNYASKGSKVELVGKEDVQGVNAYKIKLTSKDSSVSTFFIDPDKYYIVKNTRMQNAGGQQGEATFLFSDYKKTDFGLVVPYVIEIQLPQISIKTTMKKVEVNQPVDESIFKAS